MPPPQEKKEPTQLSLLSKYVKPKKVREKNLVLKKNSEKPSVSTSATTKIFLTNKMSARLSINSTKNPKLHATKINHPKASKDPNQPSSKIPIQKPSNPNKHQDIFSNNQKRATSFQPTAV